MAQCQWPASPIADSAPTAYENPQTGRITLGGPAAAYFFSEASGATLRDTGLGERHVASDGGRRTTNNARPSAGTCPNWWRIGMAPDNRRSIADADRCRYSSCGRLSTSLGRVLGFGWRAAVAGGAAIAAATFAQVPSAHHRLYQRQHVDVAA